MDQAFQQRILNATGADSLFKMTELQTLWSGYGSIARYGLSGVECGSIIIKHVRPPQQMRHPRGWNTDFSHQRKINSYQVESTWYQYFSGLCDEGCRVPQCLALDAREDEFLMALEDLDASGFSSRKQSVTLEEMRVCLAWLAQFHATFMGFSPQGLWPTGTYWHLATRPHELAALEDSRLKAAAPQLDQWLSNSPYQTLVHGDAKLANFCFSTDGRAVAAVDFQYVGGGSGIKDVAYFIGSCLQESDCERYEKALLDSYFRSLKMALAQRNTQLDPDAVERAWRPLYAVAWTDFYRFLKGWSPGHWKIHAYSERIAHRVMAQLEQKSE